MSSRQPIRETNPSIGNRAWYVLISFLLLLLTLVPWFNGIAPGRSPLRFFQSLPAPAVNILFALYVGAIILFGWMAITWQSGIRQAWYRFWLALASLVMCLIMADSLIAGWGLLIVGLVLFTAAFAELVFLFSR